MQTELGKYLKGLRSSKKKSLRQVEVESGISNAHLSQVEKGSIEKPSVELLEKLAKYYFVEISHLKRLAGHSSELIDDETSSILVPLKFITATQLNTYADSKEAEGVLPELVRDLIVSTVNVKYLNMPVGDSVFMHGWDGILNCRESSALQFIPEGVSYWEMSKAKNITEKIKKDASKRGSKIDLQEMLDGTYVQVTFRRMNKDSKQKKISELKDKYSWKDVIIVDAEALELWLERSPVVALAYAKRIGVFPAVVGLIPLSEFWNRWWNSTTPAIDEALLLEAGKHCADVKKFASNSTLNQAKIKSNDFDLGVAYYYAAIASLDDKKLSQSIISRSMIVENEEAFRLLAQRGKGLTLIPKFYSAPIGEAKSNGHRIVNISNNFDPYDLDTIGRVHSSKIAELLKVEGSYPNEKAYRIAQSCYGNLSVLRLMLADEGERSFPSWAKSEVGGAILPLVMLGGWDASNENDKKIVEKLSGKAYDEIEGFLASISGESSFLYQKINSSYTFYQEYCYSYLNGFLNAKNLGNFLAVSEDILSEINTKYELDADKRVYADILYKKGNRYSSKIRLGTATSMAILASRDLSQQTQIQSAINYAVSKILGDKVDWIFWASLNDVMTLLAEAAPSVFLDKVEKACRKNEFIQLFQQTSRFGSFGGCEHAPMLWALESCAWYRKYFKQTSRILFYMMAYESKESNFVNQPSATLKEIYRLWEPQCNVLFEERVAILKDLEIDCQEQIWKLIVQLIPKDYETGGYTYRPRFREDDVKTQVGELTYFGAVSILCNYILSFLERDPSKWLDTLEIIFAIRPHQFQDLLMEALLKTDSSRISKGQKALLFKELERKLTKHLKYQNAAWSAKGDLLQKLRKAYKKFSPDDVREKWVQVFAFFYEHPEIASADYDYDKSQGALISLQCRALREILQDGIDLNAIRDLLDKVPEPWVLGRAFAESFQDKFSQVIKLVMNGDKAACFIKGLIFKTYHLKGEVWLEQILKDELFSDAHMRALCFLALPIKKAILDRLENEDQAVQRYFWVNTIRQLDSENFDMAIFIAKKFLEYSRVLDAFFVLASGVERGIQKVPSDLLMSVLDGLISFDFGDKSKLPDLTLLDYNLEKVLRELGGRSDVDKKKLAVFEWNFLPLFRSIRKPENLMAEVSNDPKLFIDILQIAYKRDDLKDDGEQSQAALSRAFQFLNDYKTVPGMGKDRVFDAEHFKKWFFEGRDLAIQYGRLEAFDSVLGQFLAYSPSDPTDQTWPHIVVRDVIEKYASKDMESSLRMGMYNKRGVYVKLIGEGGNQTREIANSFAENAEKLELSWPKVAQILRDVESDYLDNARREDLMDFDIR